MAAPKSYFARKSLSDPWIQAVTVSDRWWVARRRFSITTERVLDALVLDALEGLL